MKSKGQLTEKEWREFFLVFVTELHGIPWHIVSDELQANIKGKNFIGAASYENYTSWYIKRFSKLGKALQ